MKEWFTLFKSDLLPICSYHHAFPLFMPKTKRIALHHSLALCKGQHKLAWHIKKSDESNLYLLLFTKRVIRWIHTLKRANCTFALKKQADHTKNQRANSQTWKLYKNKQTRRWTWSENFILFCIWYKSESNNMHSATMLVQWSI